MLAASQAAAVKINVLPWEYCTDNEVQALKTWQVDEVFLGKIVVSVNGTECLLTPRQIERLKDERFQAVNK